MLIHFFRVCLLAILQQDKTLIKIFPDYVHYDDIFFPDLPMELRENIGINEHAIELFESK